MKKIFLPLVLLVLFFLSAPGISAGQPEAATPEPGTAYIFVHGLSGWGRYDAAYRFMGKWNNIRPFYLELVGMIEQLSAGAENRENR